MNYTTLVQEVKDFLETDETTFNANIANFISLTEEKIYRQVLSPKIRKNATSTTTASDQYLSTPSDFLAAFSLSVDDAAGAGPVFLRPKDVNFMREAFPLVASTGTPRYYAMFDDDTIILGPTPLGAYTAELHYYYRPETMSATNLTTWAGDNAENAMLYGCLLHGYTFLKGEKDLIENYASQFMAGIEEVKKVGEDMNRRDEYRNGMM